MTTPGFLLPHWYDLHAHFRQEELLAPLVQAHLAMGCCGIVAMPNTRPPVTRVMASEAGEGWSIETYRQQLLHAANGRLEQVIVPLYLSATTTPQQIAAGAASGLLRAAKYYPPHGTTGAQSAIPLEQLISNGVIAELERHDLILCLHGEAHGLEGERYFDRDTHAEELFYRQQLPTLVERFPRLRIVAEHLTSRVGVEMVRQAGPQVAATITPQHLLYTVGHLLQNLKYHLYCLPLVKFQEDRQALRAAVTAADNRQFFAGTDSAPHTHKVTPCGCAAGCFTGGIAPQLYAEAFEQAGIALDEPAGQQTLRRFLVENGANFYRLPIATQQMRLWREPNRVEPLATPAGVITPLPVGIGPDCHEGAATLNWRLEIDA